MDKIGTKLFKYSDNEYLYMSDGSFLIENVTTWKYNRPSDNMKITEIVNLIEENNRNTIEGIIYLAYIDGKYVCYDGNHRLEALKLLNTKKLVLVNIFLAKNDEQIKARFVEINKSNPVPELYTVSGGEDIEKLKKIIENVVDNICKTYSKYRSPSKNPRRPNFNKDKLIEKMYEKYSGSDVSKISTSQIYDKILQLNLEYSKERHMKHSKFSDSIIKKCKKGGCYLFLKDFTEDL